MWNNYRMHYWKIYDDSIVAEWRWSGEDTRSFFIDQVTVYANNGESKTLWTFGERWWATNGKLVQIFDRTCYDTQSYSAEVLTFNSSCEAYSFMMMLYTTLRAEDNNEICKMLSSYICKKLLQADPEKIYQMRKEARAYEEALAKKKAQERETAKRLALIKKRANQKRQRGDGRRPAHVYIFSFDECFCKIGIANNVADRRRIKIAETGRMIVQWAYSKLFSREAAEEVEQLCHAHFNKSRTYGEFFTITFDEACVYLQSLVKEPLVICKKEET